MARKSRKVAHETEITPQTNINKCFKTAIYTRLSAENSGKEESRKVIETQVDICKNYIDENIDLDLVGIYKDNGISGTLFDRPEFNRLLADISSGKINCLVVKDLSRFGRDYIETGTYIEQIFPSLNVRFISISERYDSLEVDNSNESLMIPLQNLINTLYAKDISRRISTTVRSKIQSGTYKLHNLPYGYMLSEDRTKIIVDTETSNYVKMMFKWKIEGVPVNTIVKRLIELNAPSVELRKHENKTRKGKILVGEEPWNKKTVHYMLRNPMYVGDSVFNKSYRAYYKNIPYHETKKDEWIVFKDTHEAIVSREDFSIVEKMFKNSLKERNDKLKKSEKSRSEIVNLFQKKIFCGDCSKAMQIMRVYRKINDSDFKRVGIYRCHSSRKYSAKYCDSHTIYKDELDEQVLRTIKMQVKTAADYEKILMKMVDNETYLTIKDKQNAQIKSLKIRINSLLKKRTKLYEDYIEGLLSDDEYLFAREVYEVDYTSLNLQLEESIIKQQEFNEALSPDNKWIKLMKSTISSKKLTQELVDEFVDHIKIYKGNKIEIVMKYADVYKLMVCNLEKIQGISSEEDEETEEFCCETM